METFTMSRKELHRPGLLKAACAGRITTRQVAEALRISLRQARRLKRRFEVAGAAGLMHRSRGRPSPRRLATATRGRGHPEAARGALVQIDGSPFAWLEERGADLVLIGPRRGTRPSRSRSATGSAVSRVFRDWLSMARPLLVGRLYTAFSEPPARPQERRLVTTDEFFRFA
jgi:hypothetical protein